MSKKPKKQLTTKQKQARYRAGQIGCYFGMGLSVATPSLIYGVVNFDEWFVKNPEGYKIGIGAAIGFVVTGIIMFFMTQKKEKELKVTEGWITFIACALAIGFTLKMLGDILYEIANVVLWSCLGIAGAVGFDIASKKLKRNADAFKAARATVKQESIEDQARREVEEEQERPVD